MYNTVMLPYSNYCIVLMFNAYMYEYYTWHIYVAVAFPYLIGRGVTIMVIGIMVVTIIGCRVANWTNVSSWDTFRTSLIYFYLERCETMRWDWEWECECECEVRKKLGSLVLLYLFSFLIVDFTLMPNGCRRLDDWPRKSLYLLLVLVFFSS